MKHRVVSISLGSSKRDATHTLEFMGEHFQLERIGTDGSMEQAGALLRELDGKVAAFGLGGTDLYLVVGKRRYSFRDIKQLVANAKITPVLDGSGLKHTLEREAIGLLEPEVGWKNRRVLMVSAFDRFGMAEALEEAGAKMIYGDAIFGLGWPLPIRSFAMLRFAAQLVLPVVTQLPFSWFYPTGKKQERHVQDWRSRYYDWAEVIAGDFLYVNRYRPTRLEGKTILTQTITQDDRRALQEAGLTRLITTTPKLGERNFATNVLEALFVALSGKNHELESEEYLRLIRELKFRPEIDVLN